MKNEKYLFKIIFLLSCIYIVICIYSALFDPSGMRVLFHSTPLEDLTIAFPDILFFSLIAVTSYLIKLRSLVFILILQIAWSLLFDLPWWIGKEMVVGLKQISDPTDLAYFLGGLESWLI